MLPIPTTRGYKTADLTAVWCADILISHFSFSHKPACLAILSDSKEQKSRGRTIVAPTDQQEDGVLSLDTRSALPAQLSLF